MARPKHMAKGLSRVNNLRIGDMAKQALQDVKEFRERRGIFLSLNQLSVEAAFLLRHIEMGDKDPSPGPVRPSTVV